MGRALTSQLRLALLGSPQRVQRHWSQGAPVHATGTGCSCSTCSGGYSGCACQHCGPRAHRWGVLQLQQAAQRVKEKRRERKQSGFLKNPTRLLIPHTHRRLDQTTRPSLSSISERMDTCVNMEPAPTASMGASPKSTPVALPAVEPPAVPADAASTELRVGRVLGCPVTAEALPSPVPSAPATY